MPFWALISLINTAIAFILAAFVYFFDKHNPVNRVFSALCLALGTWGFSEFMYRQADSPGTAALWVKLVSVWAFVPALLFHFCLIFTGRLPQQNRRFIYTAIYLPAIVVALLGILTTTISVGPVLESWGYTGAPNESSWIYWTTHIWAYLLAGITVILFLLYYFRVSDHKEKKKTLYIILALLGPVIVSVTTEVILPHLHIDIPELSTTSFCWLAIVFVYAIWKFELFTVDPAKAADHIVAIMSDALFLCNGNKHVVYVNEAGRRLLGYRQSEILGKSVTKFIPRQDIESDSIDTRNLTQTTEIKLRAKSGKEIPVSLSASVIMDKNHTIAGFAFIAHNLAHRFEYEQKLQDMMNELKRSNKELEQFAYVTSHDLQEPLRMVASFVSLLERRYGDQLDDKAREYILMAKDGAERMHMLIQDLLTYSRIATRAREPLVVSCEKVLKDVLRNLILAIEENQAQIKYDSLPNVMIDPQQLERLLQNLIGNAIKFRSEASPVITIHTEKQNGFWKFAISDNGIGIPENAYERIFGVFQRLHTREAYPGTGIGLALCKKIVEQHGGQIWVNSKEGAGSAFYFTLPAG